MNKVILMGRLTDDPSIRQIQDKTLAEYTLAVDRRVAKGEQKADYIRCQGWEKKADFAGKYTNKKGDTVYTTDVVVEDQEFAESKKAETSEFMTVTDDMMEDSPFK